ncbi:MAG: GNAT family N-acetyltransferase [Bacteroidota bacterium]
MHPDISIRYADTEDINTIGFLAQQVWPHTYSNILSAEQLNYMLNLFYAPTSLRKQMQEDKHVFLVIEDDQQPVGFASYSDAGNGIYKLHKIYVLPNRQGKGLGKIIVDFIVNEIRPQGATALQLNVNRYNKARNFYERLGFTVIKEEDINIGNDYFMNDYVMEKPI